MKITILDDYQNCIRDLDCFQILDNYNTQIITQNEKDIDKLATLLFDSEIIVLIRERTEITDELLKKLPKLRLISQTGKISKHIDIDACRKRNILVAEGIGSPIAPAELTWGLILNSIRRIPQSIQSMKIGNWQTEFGDTIHGKTLGIWGYGKIGSLIAKYGITFGAKVMIWGSENSRDKAIKEGLVAAKTKEEFFEISDIITLHLRLNDSTIGIVKETDLLRMKTNSIFVNTSRAELIEKNALLNSINKGRPGFAALDVFDFEPVYDKNYELLQHKNVICTPHIGFVSKSSYEMYFEAAFKNVVNYINNNPTNIFN